MVVKSNVKTLNQLVEEEIDKRVKQFYTEAANDLVHQTIAYCLMYMEKRYNFRKKRLENLLDSLQGMMECQFFGKELNSLELIEYFKQEYGVDIRKMKVEVKNGDRTF